MRVDGQENGESDARWLDENGDRLSMMGRVFEL